MLTGRPLPPRIWMLVGALLAAGFTALSIHVGLLAAGVPFPLPNGPAWAEWLYDSTVAGGVLAFLSYARPRLGRRSILTQALVTFLIIAAVQETLRAAIMNGVVTGGWGHSALSLVKPVLSDLIFAFLCVIAARWTRSPLSFFGAALAVGALTGFADDAIKAAMAPVLEAFAWLARDDLYGFPYPAHVMIAAYATFIEAVAGVTLMAALTWEQISASRTVRLLTLAALTATVKGVAGGTFLLGFFTGENVWIGMFSWSQFLLEFLALGLLVGLAWETLGPRSTLAGQLAQPLRKGIFQ
ncbi:hypothetical protein [Brevundimonas diminuta]|uniref:hypothetical protein n=1 Tax=Brevundimonas diminuta TaxID=293 RepID=UPI003209D293